LGLGDGLKLRGPPVVFREGVMLTACSMPGWWMPDAACMHEPFGVESPFT
jgi:hypothetical protein